MRRNQLLGGSSCAHILRERKRAARSPNVGPPNAAGSSPRSQRRWGGAFRNSGDLKVAKSPADDCDHRVALLVCAHDVPDFLVLIEKEPRRVRREIVNHRVLQNYGSDFTRRPGVLQVKGIDCFRHLMLDLSPKSRPVDYLGDVRGILQCATCQTSQATRTGFRSARPHVGESRASARR